MRGQAEHLPEFAQIIAASRELLVQRLDRVPHVFTYVKPEGAYYIFPTITAPHTTAVDFARQLLAGAKVTVTPGSAFGPTGEHHVRMAFCVTEENGEGAG